jgi:hypothetical protein
MIDNSKKQHIGNEGKYGFLIYTNHNFLKDCSENV